MSVLLFALLVFGTTARLTRLVTADHIAGPLRAKVIRRYGEDSNPAVFITCPWCVSFWVALFVVPFGLAAWHWPHAAYSQGAAVLAAVLTLSYFTGLFATLTD